VKTDKPPGCPQCYGGEPEEVWQAIPKFPLVARLVDESHLIVSVIACPNCQQRWVKVFTELIDWVNGEDPQRWVVLPVTSEESRTLISQGENEDIDLIEALWRHRRFLCMDWPKGSEKRPSWRDGGLVVGPHD
jgi:hypothetical protein